MSKGRYALVAAMLVALGIAAAGWFVGRGFVQARIGDRFVTVKGISERDVEANLALWPLRVSGTDDDLAKAQAQLTQGIARVREFLSKYGIDEAHTELQKLEVTDAYASRFGDASKVKSRYVVKQTLLVRSDEPATILEASQKVVDLVGAGVVLSSEEDYGPAGGPTFLFTNLNDLKPEMIADAIARGREGALRFARDSESRLGGIRHANQGLFEILPRHQAPGISEGTQVLKTVRVVSTVEYFLLD